MSERRIALKSPRAELAQKLIAQDCALLRDNIREIRSDVRTLNQAIRETVSSPLNAIKEVVHLKDQIDHQVKDQIDLHPRLSLAGGLLMGFAATRMLLAPKEEARLAVKTVSARTVSPESLMSLVSSEFKKTASTCVEKIFSRMRQELGDFVDRQVDHLQRSNIKSSATRHPQFDTDSHSAKESGDERNSWEEKSDFGEEEVRRGNPFNGVHRT